MFKRRLLHFCSGLMMMTIFFLFVNPVSASHLISFANPVINLCTLTGVQVGSTNITLAVDADVDHYINGIVVYSFVNGAVTGATSWSAFTGVNPGSYPYVFEAHMYPQGSNEHYVLRVNCTAQDTGTVTFFEVVAGVSVLISETPACPVFFDGRINDCDTGNPVVVYGHDYDSGRGLLILDTDGIELLQVLPGDIGSVDECPDSNTLLASANGVAVYRLSSCEFQVNAPAADGKTYVLIFNSLYGEGYTSHEE